MKLSKNKDEVSSSDTGSHAAVVKRLFDEHNRALIGYLRARLRSQEEARDIAQEAYVKLLELDNPHAVGFLRAYLFRVATNLAIDRLRHRSVVYKEASEFPSDELCDERDPERVAIAKEDLACVRRAIIGLPHKCRKAFLWYIFDDQSTTQIGARLRLSDRMIRFYIAQALAACQAEIDARRSPRGD